MKCGKCGCDIRKGDETEYMGKILCEDCHMDAFSTAKACDPWAVFTAKSMSGKNSPLTDLQQRIIALLKETDGIEPELLAEKVDLKLDDLLREMTTLRHMEKIKATMKEGKKLFCLW